MVTLFNGYRNSQFRVRLNRAYFTYQWLYAKRKAIKSAIPQRQTDVWCRITCRPGSANYFKYWTNETKRKSPRGRFVLQTEISGKNLFFWNKYISVILAFVVLILSSSSPPPLGSVCRQYFVSKKLRACYSSETQHDPAWQNSISLESFL